VLGQIKQADSAVDVVGLKVPGRQGTQGVPKEPGGQVEAWVRVRRRRRRGWRGKEFMVSYAGGWWGDFGGSRARGGGRGEAASASERGGVGGGVGGDTGGDGLGWDICQSAANEDDNQRASS